MVNEAALLAARRGKDAVSMADFDEAIDRIVGGLEKKSRVMSPKVKERVAYHEVGHALIAELLPNADPVHKISIIPRGVAALGYTQQLPTEDSYLLTRSELLDRLAVLLGGRAAEELIYHEVSTGAQNDLQRATDITRSMIKEYGMSEALGPISFEPQRRALFLNTDFSSEKNYSEETAQTIDREVKQLILETYEKVKEMLQSHNTALNHVARLLLEKEVVEGETLRKIIGAGEVAETIKSKLSKRKKNHASGSGKNSDGVWNPVRVNNEEKQNARVV
jgi:cell division protease FtsH